MLPVSAAELAAIQAEAVSAACDKTCQVYTHNATTADTWAGPGESWTLTATTVAGLRQPSAGELQNYDYLIGDKLAWTVLLPVATVVNHQDHLVIGGETLEVHVILTPRSYEALRGVICAEIK